MPRSSAIARLDGALRTLRPVLDIVEGRVTDAVAPAWCERRGWSEFLLGLDASALARCETDGLARGLERIHDAPPDLVELSRAVEAVSTLPLIATTRPALALRSVENVRARKREQVGLLLGAVGPMAARAARVVDVGAGRGALTRLVAEHFALRTLGIERSPERVAAARAHADRSGGSFAAARPEFRAGDACREGLELSPDDLVIGLHACGELGDELVRTAAQVGCDAALISCCLQKISAQRRTALSRAGEGVSFSRGVVGLTNQTARSEGVEGSLEQTLSARRVRYALYTLLCARGVELEPGAAMSGINRRRAHAGLRAVAELALASRGLPAATNVEIEHHEALAEAHFQAIRRLSLPRAALARLVEVVITLDRAAYFEEHGACTTVGLLFQSAVSPRNIAVFASRDAARLPESMSSPR